MILNLQIEHKSLQPFTIDLPDFVILTGLNGAGKTHFLTALAETSKSSITNELKVLSKVKYVNSQNLIPNESGVINSESQIFEVDQAFNGYNMMKTELLTYGVGSIRDMPVISKRRLKIYEVIATRSKRSIDDLTHDDFHNFYPHSNIPDDIFKQNLGYLFKRYKVLKEQNDYHEFRKDGNHLSEKEFTELYGSEPWEIANKVLIDGGLNYSFNNPESDNRDTPFELKLINNVNGVNIKFEDLSSGERVIMSLILALFNSNFQIEYPEVILMDELDASLHPQMCSQLLKIVNEVFVQNGVKVIMTTHSPTTVALAPEGNIFVIDRSRHNIIQSVSKDTALSVLTEGVPSFSVNYENRRQVFVESSYDVLFYELLYSLVSKKLNPEVSLTFISSGETKHNRSGVGVASCDQVLNITKILRDAGNKFVWGIIDYDISENKGSSFVKVIGEGNRYSIENYLLDPVFMVALLIREKHLNKDEIGLSSSESFTDFKNFSQERLQGIVDFYLKNVIDIIKPEEVGEKVEVRLINGITLYIPKWYMQCNGHYLEEEVIMKKWPALASIKRNKQETLKLAIINFVIEEMPDILPVDIIELFINLQR